MEEESFSKSCKKRKDPNCSYLDLLHVRNQCVNLRPEASSRVAGAVALAARKCPVTSSFLGARRRHPVIETDMAATRTPPA